MIERVEGAPLPDAEAAVSGTPRFRRSFPPVASLHAREAQGLAWPTVVIEAKVSAEYRPNVLGPLTLFTVESGAAELVLQGRRLPLDEQTYALSPPNERFTLEYPEDITSRALNVYFADELVNDVAAGLAAPSPLQDRPLRDVVGGISYGRLRPTSDWLRLALRRVRRATAARGSLPLETAVTDLLAAILSTPDTWAARPATSPAEREELRRRIAFTVDYMVAHSARTLTLAELSKVCGMSKFHFLRVFCDVVGSTPSRFLTRIRIERAMSLLRATGRSVTEIALDVGFSEQSALTRAFRRQMGVPPAVFRARERH